MDNIYNNLKNIIQKKCKIFIHLFGDITADRLNPIVTVLFIKGRKLNISRFLIIKFYFAVPKQYLKIIENYMKIPNIWELQPITFNHSSDIDFPDFMNLYKKIATKPYSF